MRRSVIAVAGLVGIAGCAGEPAAPPIEILTPGPGETFADPEDKVVQACLTVVSRNTGTPGVMASGMASGPEGTTVTVAGGGKRWSCYADDRGRVTAMIPMS